MANRLPVLPVDANGRIVNDPLSQYAISDIDDVAEPQYYGYLSVDPAGDGCQQHTA